MQANKPIPYRKIVPMINQLKMFDDLSDNKQQIASVKKTPNDSNILDEADENANYVLGYN